MKPVLTLFQIMALVGFALSLVVHVSSIFGVKAFSGAEALHVGIFVVFIPAMFVNLGTFRRIRSNQREVWKILLRGCPKWMVTATYTLAGYAVLNFIYFMVFITPHVTHMGAGGAMSPEILRGFSGHWLIFYWASFAILYSRTHIKGPFVPLCPNCQSAASPFDKFCPNCGQSINLSV